MKDIKRLAAVHDISGFGKASLTVVIPILSTMGIQVCPMPTAVLSAISEFPQTRMKDLSGFMDEIIEHWQKLGLKFDAIYSGFLGSPRQVKIVQKLISETAADKCLNVIDPVMGDNGKLYSVFSPDIISSMQELVKSAQVITPNLTEAAFLLDEKTEQLLSRESVIEWLQRLVEMGPQTVIITSVPGYEEANKTCTFAYDKIANDYWKMSCSYLPGNFPGTGDMFTSIITGCLMQNIPLSNAIEKAAHFVYDAIGFSLDYVTDRRQGIYFEPLLPELLKSGTQLEIQKLEL
ncbi:MAG: pyridoxamine kinase [Candidatus Cloacimonetes bacterium]|nr:pyridoxamine kinase [Candidatus Cloacimonadota bacterium]